MMFRVLVKCLLGLYWLLFVGLTVWMCADWQSVLGFYDVNTQIFILFMSLLGCIVPPYLIFYWPKLSPHAAPPYLLRMVKAKMDHLEDIHSGWYEVLLVVKYVGLFIVGMWGISVILSTLIIIGWALALLVLNF